MKIIILIIVSVILFSCAKPINPLREIGDTKWGVGELTIPPGFE